MDISSNFFHHRDPSSFQRYRRYKIPAGALYTSGGKNLAIFERNRRLSRKRCQIGPLLLMWITNKTSCRSTRVDATDLERP